MDVMDKLPTEDLQKQVRDFYKSSLEYCHHLSTENEVFFQRFMNLIDRYGTKAERVLDAGCGTGLSTHLISQKSKKPVGVDISYLFLQNGRNREGGQRIPFVAGDLLSLPFKDASFDLVISYLVIETLPDVRKGLQEMIRVLRGGGIFIAFNANLLSPAWPLKDFFRMLMGRAGRPVWCETPGAALWLFFRNLFLSTAKLFQKDVRFLYKYPDMTYDKCVGRGRESFYLACPMDLINFLTRNGFRILRKGDNSGLLGKLFPLFSPAVEIVAEKI